MAVIESNRVHVSYSRRIQEADFGKLGEVRDAEAHSGILGFKPAQGLGQVEADAVRLVHIHHHPVGGIRPDAGAPLAGGDNQLLSLAGGDVVLQHVGEDGALGIVGDLAGHQLAKLLHGHQDVVGQGVGRAVVALPDGGDGGVDIREDLIRGFVLPAGGGAGGVAARGGAGHIGIVAKAGGGRLAEAHIDVAVNDLVAVEADALVQEGHGIPAYLHHLFPFDDVESLIRGSDTTIKMHPLEGARGCRGGAYLLQSAVLLSVKLLSSFQQQF